MDQNRCVPLKYRLSGAARGHSHQQGAQSSDQGVDPYARGADPYQMGWTYIQVHGRPFPIVEIEQDIVTWCLQINIIQSKCINGQVYSTSQDRHQALSVSSSLVITNLSKYQGAVTHSYISSLGMSCDNYCRGH